MLLKNLRKRPNMKWLVQDMTATKVPSPAPAPHGPLPDTALPDTGLCPQQCRTYNRMEI
jgi:hypothetical protein